VSLIFEKHVRVISLTATSSFMFLIYSRDSNTVVKTEPIKKTIIELYSRLREVDVVRSVYWQRKVDSVV
jgi:hypothetical protein